MTASAAELAPLDLHQSFQDFVAARPDEEKWELVAGRFLMRAQPNIDHQIIAGNLDRLLTDGIERLRLGRISVQNPAIDLRPTLEGHVYVPDVAVIDADEVEPGRNVVSACFLAVEILSPSDRRKPAGTKSPKIAIKLCGYEALPTCEAVLLVEQRAFDATLSERSGSAWVHRRLTDPDDRLVIASAGLDCRLGDVYARTTLARARR
ncbi:Uma2 family endonuclease [Methylobacterium pseudosasicola]|uniref:Endonuclease, Uma2 family (Restriction endonuclease fold) n=1 Tax=Methylobacterium pseudosasicola TaxID=582667 RepID=A0A1I4HVW6_9HYPH|nr:Uma2 family endonuclease [Methylobacterium pseudosasicola]SFL46335.1 Endonuclease, Uma2 family (restriction endonuclease fold) [Methylobacterium pseudosasicola]